MNGWSSDVMAAARCGDAAALRALIAKHGKEALNARSNTWDHTGSFSPLHHAAFRGSEECVRLLVEAGADKTARNNDTHTPWHLASTAAVARLLVPDGLDAKTSALVAAGTNDAGSLRELLAGRRGAAADVDECQYTPLHHAARCGAASCVEALLSAGADGDAKAHHFFTALFLAAESGHAQCVELLLRAGVNKEVPPFLRCTTALGGAVANGHTACVELLLRAGADKNAKDINGRSVVHIAASEGQGQCLELLLRAGAAHSTRTSGGWTPLHCAAWKGSRPCIELLIRAGAEKNAKDTMESATPLSLAAKRGMAEAVEALVRAGADKNAVNGRAETPLHEAAMLGEPRCVEALLRAGAQVDARCCYGTTPLHAATATADEGSERCVQLLLQAGADPLAATKTARYDWPAGMLPSNRARNAKARRLLLRAESVARLTPLAAAAARRELFDPRLFDPALWRLVARFCA